MGDTKLSDQIQQVFMLGIGAASLTKEKVEELVDELVKRGQITADQGRELLDEASEKAKQEGQGIKEMASDTYRDAMRALGVASTDSVAELERRLDVLEAKVYGKQSRVEEPATGFSSTMDED